MPANEQTKSLDQRRQEAVRDIEHRLVAMGVNPEAAATRTQAIADRLYLGGKGPIRVLTMFSSGEMYPASWEDPLAPIVGEIFRGIPAEEKLKAEEQREKDIEEMAEEKQAGGGYRDL